MFISETKRISNISSIKFFRSQVRSARDLVIPQTQNFFHVNIINICFVIKIKDITILSFKVRQQTGIN